MPAADLKPAVIAAYKRLLGPLVRILIRNGVSFPEFSELAKEVYVDVAAKDIRNTDNNTVEGRIAIVTGLTRNDVRRVREDKNRSNDTDSNLGRVARILSGWHTDPEFTGPYGLPLDVPMDSYDQRCFREIVRRYTNEVTAEAMLDELLRIDVVQKGDNGRIKVLTRTYLPKTDTPESLDRLGLVVHDFVKTIDFNRSETDPGNRLFERRVSTDAGLREDDLPLFQKYVRERGQFLLEELDDWISRRAPLEDHEKPRAVNTGVGLYHYIVSDETS